MGDDGLVEALLKFAAEPVDAPLGFLGELLLGGAVLDGTHILAHLEFEFLHQRGELGFQFAGAIAKFDVAFAGEFGTLLIRAYCCSRAALRSSSSCVSSLCSRSRKRAISDLLRAETFAGGVNDGAIKAETFSGLDAG